MMLRGVTCCFTGHRMLPREIIAPLEAALDHAIDELHAAGYTRFLSGGALGFDQLAAQTVLKARQRHPDIRLDLILPCRTQADRWHAADRFSYQALLGHADAVRYVCEDYIPGCMMMRNRALIHESSACVSYATRESGGTAYTLRYARKSQLYIINLAPPLQIGDKFATID